MSKAKEQESNEKLEAGIKSFGQSMGIDAFVDGESGEVIVDCEAGEGT